MSLSDNVTEFEVRIIFKTKQKMIQILFVLFSIKYEKHQFLEILMHPKVELML
jgi:hypothetical protein